MTARLSERDEGAASDRSSTSRQDHSAAPLPFDRNRVVSVSARQTDEQCTESAEQGVDAKMANGTAGTAKTVFLTPRVIDQEAFDDLARTLCDLIERASEHGTNLTEAVAEAGRVEGQIAQSSVNLQERLRLGARMLKAFQSQIVRIESGIAELEEQFKSAEATKADFDAARDETISEVQEALNRASDQTVAKLDEAIAVRMERLEAIEGRLGAIEARTESSEQAIEAAEQQSDLAVQRAEQVCQRLESKQAEARSVIEQCEEVKRILGEDLIQATDAVDRVEQRCGEVADGVRVQDERLASMHPRIEQLVKHLNGLADRLNETEQLRSELAAMIERLHEWEPLLRCSGEQGDAELPEPLVRTVETIRARVEASLGVFSSALRHMADDFEQFAGDATKVTGQSASDREQSSEER